MVTSKYGSQFEIVDSLIMQGNLLLYLKQWSFIVYNFFFPI